MGKLYFITLSSTDAPTNPKPRQHQPYLLPKMPSKTLSSQDTIPRPKVTKGRVIKIPIQRNILTSSAMLLGTIVSVLSIAISSTRPSYGREHRTAECRRGVCNPSCTRGLAREAGKAAGRTNQGVTSSMALMRVLLILYLVRKA